MTFRVSDMTDVGTLPTNAYIHVASNGTSYKWHVGEELLSGVGVSVMAKGAVGDNVTDDSAAIQAALNEAAEIEGVVFFPPAFSYKIDSGLEWDVNQVRIEGNGARLNFLSLTSGAAFTVIQSNNDANARGYRNITKGIHNLILQGPGVDVTAVTAIHIHDDTGLFSAALIPFSGISFVDFAQDVYFGDGAFEATFTNCVFTASPGHPTPTTYSLNMPLATNAGERNTFENCAFFNRDLILLHQNGDNSTHFVNCSFDYCGRIMTLEGGGTFVTGGHIEGNDDTDYWFHVSGSNTRFSAADFPLVVTAAKDNFSPFYCDADVTAGGLILRSPQLSISLGFTTHLIEGAGLARVDGPVTQYSGTARPPIGESSNLLAYGDIESANWDADWTFIDATKVTQSATFAHGGTKSLRIEGVVATTEGATFTREARPGDNFSGELWYKTVALTGTSGSFIVQADWMDNGGGVVADANSLAATALLTATTTTDWTRLAVSMSVPAPKGTAYLRVILQIFGVASGAPFAYVDDAVFNLA